MPSFDFLVNNTEQSSSGFVDGSIRSSALFIVCDGLFPTYNRWFFLVNVFHGLYVSISMAAYIEFQLFIKNHPKKVSELNLKSKQNCSNEKFGHVCGFSMEKSLGSAKTNRYDGRVEISHFGIHGAQLNILHSIKLSHFNLMHFCFFVFKTDIFNLNTE